MSKLLWLVILPLAFVHASWDHVPQDFTVDGNAFTFIDIQEAQYHIEFDISNKKTIATSKLVFQTRAAGQPIFDLVPGTNWIKINDQTTQLISVRMPDSSPVRSISTQLPAGTHTLTMQHEIKKNVQYSSWFGSYVRAGFWMSDLSDRSYLEQYLPTNLEYDQIKMQMTIKILGTDTQHLLKTNGVITQIGTNEFAVDYPEFYASSSMFFHLYPVNSFKEKEFTYQSMDGRSIQLQIYTKDNSTLESAARQAPAILKELEKDYGPWPHPHLIVYVAGMGGMEHVGATQTSLSALGHEMHHSYFARGIIPARGNDGWIDEALASWRDANYRQSSLGDLEITSMAAHSPYRRTTDTAAYGAGERIIGHLDQKFRAQGGMKSFLKDFAEKNMYSMNTTEYFRTSMEQFFDVDLKAFFDKYISGKRGLSSNHKHMLQQHPVHRVLTEQEQLDLL